MTKMIFVDWLIETDKMFSLENRKILLLMGDSFCHTDIGVELSNIRIVYFPSNTVSQPLDLGIIYSFKSHYRLTYNEEIIH